MMNKTIFLALISVFALPLFAELKQTQILKEDFESAAPKLKIGRHSGLSSEKRETISGKTSLVCRAPKGAYPTAFHFRLPTTTSLKSNSTTRTSATCAPAPWYISKTRTARRWKSAANSCSPMSRATSRPPSAYSTAGAAKSARWKS